MADINLNIERCKGCGMCVGACPNEVIDMSEDLNDKGYHFAEIIDKDKCTGCGLCYRMCPDIAIEITK
jgi:2-oxoglutarate ferredoxin oxidoreductase subunit delta